MFYQVSEMYAESHRIMTERVKDYVPPSWVSMSEVKSQYFSALAHHYTVVAILDQPGMCNKLFGNVFTKEPLNFLLIICFYDGIFYLWPNKYSDTKGYLLLLQIVMM